MRQRAKMATQRVLARWAARAALALALCAAGAQAADLRLTTEDRAPTNMLLDQQVVGTATEKVREMMARTGTTFTLDVLPWTRAYALALGRPDACAFAAVRNAARQPLFQWVGPITTTQAVLYAKAGRPFHLATLDDARPFMIGSYLGDALGEDMQQRGFRVEMVPIDQLNIKKLLLGRIDLWVGNPALMKSVGPGSIAPALILPPVDLYLACNRAVPAALIARLQAALAGMERDGTSLAIEKKYQNVPLTPGGVAAK